MKIEQCCSPSRAGRYCKKWNTARSTLHRVCLHPFKPNQKIWNCEGMFWIVSFCRVDWRQLTEIRANLGPYCSLSLSLTFTHVGSRTWPSLRQRHTESYFKSIKSREICFVSSPWFSFELATGSVNWFKLLNYSLRQQARPTGIISSVCPKTSFRKIKSTGLSKF